MNDAQLQRLAAETGLSKKKLLRKLASGAINVAEEGAAFSSTEADKLAKRAKKDAKLKKWSARLAVHGVNYKSLSKAERREARARWRVERALGRLEKVLGGKGTKRTAGRSDRIVDTAAEHVGRTRAGQLVALTKAADPAADSRRLSEPEIAAANLARARSSL
jgi:hypothetical protein